MFPSPFICSFAYAGLRRRRIRANPANPDASNAADIGSGTVGVGARVVSAVNVALVFSARVKSMISTIEYGTDSEVTEEERWLDVDVVVKRG
jgi:hypothetical protein